MSDPESAFPETTFPVYDKAADALPSAFWYDLVGEPYVEDGCLKLVVEVHRRMGFEVPDSSVARIAAEWSESWDRVGDPRPGDAVAWRLPKGDHIGIIVARWRALHASENAGVVVSTFDIAHAAGFFRPKPALRAASRLGPFKPGHAVVRLVKDALAGDRETLIIPADGATLADVVPKEWRIEGVRATGPEGAIPREAWGATPLRAELTITDTKTGVVKQYTSAFGGQAGKTDFTAFVK